MDILPGLETPIPEDRHPVRSPNRMASCFSLGDPGEPIITPEDPGFNSPKLRRLIGSQSYLPSGHSTEDPNQARSYQSHQTEHNVRSASPSAEDRAKEVMEHIISTLLEEHLGQGPIRSAFTRNGYYLPHQLMMADPHTLLTDRTASGEHVEGSHLPQQAMGSLLNLQAYHNALLRAKNQNTQEDGPIFLEWAEWMSITHTDLMRFFMDSKKQAQEQAASDYEKEHAEQFQQTLRER